MAREFIMDALMVEADERAREQVYWSGWEKWLRGHLDIEREGLIEALGEALGQSRFDLRNEIEAKINAQVKALELRIAELTGAVDVLRGNAPPPPAKFPCVKAWRKDVVYYAADVVAFGGCCYQAVRDTAQAPGTSRDWICLAQSGRDGESLDVRGTYDANAAYQYLDIVALNGGSFIARNDKPGPCPGPGWQLLASPGKRGMRGPAGVPGPRGPPMTIQAWQLDRANYVAIPLMSDGSQGPPLELRGLFEQFIVERGERWVVVKLSTSRS